MGELLYWERAAAMALTHGLYSPGELAAKMGADARQLRLAQNISRKTLAERTGVSESTIKRFEGTGQISLEGLMLVACVLKRQRGLADVFRQEAPVSLETLKQPVRVRGRR